jgi:hypothetical protein
MSTTSTCHGYRPRNTPCKKKKKKKKKKCSRHMARLPPPRRLAALSSHPRVGPRRVFFFPSTFAKGTRDSCAPPVPERQDCRFFFLPPPPPQAVCVVARARALSIRHHVPTRTPLRGEWSSIWVGGLESGLGRLADGVVEGCSRMRLM